MKTLNQFLEEANEMVEAQEIQESELINEVADIELSPHPTGVGHIIRKINHADLKKHFKPGEHISDSDVDDLEMGNSVKFHSK